MSTINGFVLHVDRILTNISVMYRNANFVAASIFPLIPVEKQSDLFLTWGKDNLRSIADGIAPRALSNEITLNRATTPYYADGHALSYPLADEEAANDDMMDLSIDVTTILCDQSFLNREINCLAAITAGITTTIDLSASSGADQFSNDTFDPMKYIDQQKIAVAQVTGKKPNTLVLSTPVLAGLRNNALVKARITGAPNLDGSAITLQQLANVMELKQVLEASAVVNTAKEGQADNLQFVWGKQALLCYVPDAPGPRTLSLGYHFMWNFKATAESGRVVSSGDLIPGGAGFGVRQWYRPGIRSTQIEFLNYYAQQIVCPDAGILFTNAVA